MNNYDYPTGSDHFRAPWNQSDPEEVEFNVIAFQSLSKEVDVTTNDYIEGDICTEVERDFDGGWTTSYSQDPPDTSNTDWETAYSSEHLTPLELIQELKEIKLTEVGNIKARISQVSNPNEKAKLTTQLARAKYILSECEGWNSDTFEVIKN